MGALNGSRYAAALSFLALAFLSERPWACSSAGVTALEVSNDHSGEAPGAVSDVSVTVSRGKGARMSGCGHMSSTSCDDIGTITLHFVAATDADSPARSVGYRVDLVDGEAPGDALIDYTDRAALPFFEVGDERHATLYFNWLDGADNDQERLDFYVTLTPVDANGNEGPTSDPIRIHDDGSGAGCSVRNGSAMPTSLTALIAFVGAATVRRATRRRSRAVQR